MKEELEKLLKEGYVSTGISYADSEIYKKDKERVVYNMKKDKRVCKVIKSGYLWEKEVIRKQLVSVYEFTATDEDKAYL